MTERDAPIFPALLLIGAGFGAMLGTYLTLPGALTVAMATTVIGLLLLVLWRRE